MQVNAGLCAICLMAAVLLVGCKDAGECPNCNEGAELCPTSPLLRASADDGEATLEWEPAVGLGTTAKAWQFRQALQGESWSVNRSTSPAATAYVVSGLTNDKAYTFQVRAQLDAADFACWSAPVTVVPRRVDDVMEEIEKHQRAIAERMAEVVKGMADGQEALRALGEQGIAALEAAATALKAAATSTSEVAGHVTAIRDGVGQVAVASRELAEIREATDDVAENIDEVGDEVARGISRIEERLARLPAPPTGAAQYCDGRIEQLGELYFGHDSFVVKDDEAENAGTIGGAVEYLNGIEDGGLILTVGHATAIGVEGHNMHLSDQRAACASRCIHDSLADPTVFEFREVAKGEALAVRDPAGTSEWNRRVEVMLCRDVAFEPGRYSGSLSDVMPAASECECPEVGLEGASDAVD